MDDIDERLRQNIEERRRLYNQRQQVFGAHKLEPGQNPKPHTEEEMLIAQVLINKEAVLDIDHQFLRTEKQPGYNIDETALTAKRAEHLHKIEEIEKKLAGI